MCTDMVLTVNNGGYRREQQMPQKCRCLDAISSKNKLLHLTVAVPNILRELASSFGEKLPREGGGVSDSEKELASVVSTWMGAHYTSQRIKEGEY
jgi:hypothetical protein